LSLVAAKAVSHLLQLLGNILSVLCIGNIISKTYNLSQTGFIVGGGGEAEDDVSST
jgi:hypothetical protein